MCPLDTSISIRDKRRRTRKISTITKKQMSLYTDLPRKQRGTKKKRVDIREIPFSAISHKRLSIGLPIGVTPHTYLPPEERTYVDGREWTIG